MTYRRKPVTEPLKEYIQDELAEVEKEFALFDFVTLKKLYAPPNKLFDGLIAFADGTSWNPGGGQGAYIYYAASWNKLG